MFYIGAMGIYIGDTQFYMVDLATYITNILLVGKALNGYFGKMRGEGGKAWMRLK